MLYNDALNRASGAKRASEIDREARVQELQLAQLRARFSKQAAAQRTSNFFQKTGLLLKTLFLNF